MSFRMVLDANFLTGILCGVKDKHKTSICFTTVYIGENNKKARGRGTAGVSEEGSGQHNCPILNVHNVVPRVRRMNICTTN